tara:strand:+ start:40 stop:501 length:462 start_codon:yes stop_codon:yes gene_type:complete
MIKIEIKTTSKTQQNRYLRIGALKNKRVSDIIRIIDSVNNKVSEIPTDIFFKSAIFDGAEFWWYVDLNPNKSFQNGKLQSIKLSTNTKLFNKYILDEEFQHTHDHVSSYFEDHRNELLQDPKILSLILERQSAKINGEKFVDAIGYDTIKTIA